MPYTQSNYTLSWLGIQLKSSCSSNVHLSLLVGKRRSIWARLEPLRPSCPRYVCGYWTAEELCSIAAEGRWSIHVCPGVVPRNASPSREGVLATDWLVVDFDTDRGAPPSASNLLLEFAYRGIPLPTLVYQTRGGGFHCWWRIPRLFLGPPHAPWRAGLLSLYEWVQRGLVALLQDLGADPHAVGIAHQFCVFPTSLVWFAPTRITPLTALSRALRRCGVIPRRPHGTHQRHWRVNTSPGTGNLSDVFAWFEQQVFPEGQRNSGFLSWLILSAWAGRFPEEEAALTWIQSHSSPPYSEHEARWVWRTCQRAFFGDPPRPYGISAVKLRALGMPEPLVQKARSLMRPPRDVKPQQPWIGPRVPVYERQKKPKLLRLIELLEGIVRHRLREASARELARLTGVPLATLTSALLPVVQLWRAPGKKFFNLELIKNTSASGRLIPAGSSGLLFIKGFRTQGILIKTVETLFRRSGLDLWRTVRFWCRREPDLWRRLLQAVHRFLDFVFSPLLPPPEWDIALPEDTEEGLVALWEAIFLAFEGPRRSEIHSRGQSASFSPENKPKLIKGGGYGS